MAQCILNEENSDHAAVGDSALQAILTSWHMSKEGTACHPTKLSMTLHVCEADGENHLSS